MLKFKDASFKDSFLARYVSDGTIKFLAYMVLLYDPKPFPLLCVEEPENQLYPHFLQELAEEFRSYSRRKQGGQVFVSTHSPEFLNAVHLNEVFYVEKIKGYAELKRAKDTSKLVQLSKETPVGELWREGWFDTSCR